eukprot:TRINITY_DN16907_c0_g4_i1.p4 TRINITY_DN16907_c0_g4~~TRINITY_DN16907_c0_g4_i1.p4  ORF type:complete len:125 (+),score=1.98 TRINITY_DN16907_c0_g4_i1:521-895(+)
MLHVCSNVLLSFLGGNLFFDSRFHNSVVVNLQNLGCSLIFVCQLWFYSFAVQFNFQLGLFENLMLVYFGVKLYLRLFYSVNCSYMVYRGLSFVDLYLREHVLRQFVLNVVFGGFKVWVLVWQMF